MPVLCTCIEREKKSKEYCLYINLWSSTPGHEYSPDVIYCTHIDLLAEEGAPIKHKLFFFFSFFDLVRTRAVLCICRQPAGCEHRQRSERHPANEWSRIREYWRSARAGHTQTVNSSFRDIDFLRCSMCLMLLRCSVVLLVFFSFSFSSGSHSD